MARDPDMIAFTGDRAVVTVDATATGGNSAVNRINLAIKDALVLVGYQLISTTVDGGGRNQYTLVSQQFPWWDDTPGVTPPASYSGRIEIFVGAFDNNSVYQIGRDVAHAFAGGPTARATMPVFAGEFWIIVTPFSGAIMRKANTAGTGNFNLFGALNTPKFLQERGLEEALYCFRADPWRTGLRPISGAGGSQYVLYKDSQVTSELDNVGGNAPILIHTQWQGDNTTLGDAGCVAFANLIDDPTLSAPDTWYPILNCAKLSWPDVNNVAPQKSRGFICDLVSRVKRQTSVDGIDIAPDGHRILWISVIQAGGLNNNAVLGVVIGGVDCPLLV